MKMKKTVARLLAMLLVLSMTAALCSCGEPAEPPTEPTSSDSSEPEKPQPTEPTDPTDPEESTPDEPDEPDEPLDPPTEGLKGQFKSETGTKLNLVVDWICGDNGVTHLDIGVESYSLYLAPRTLVVKTDVKTYRFPTDRIAYAGPALTVLPLASVDIKASAGDTLSVEWDFRGEYGDEKLDSIMAAGVFC